MEGGYGERGGRLGGTLRGTTEEGTSRGGGVRDEEGQEASSEGKEGNHTEAVGHGPTSAPSLQ